MRIELNPPHSLNEKGQRENSEDSIYPEKGASTACDRFFIVCDGVGGYDKGDLASRTVCEAFASFLTNRDLTDFNETVFEEALEYAYTQLDEKDSGDSGPKMGTTLAFVCFHEQGAFVAHIGDSRIYHLRRQGSRVDIRYKSEDHSHVNELVRAGVITAEETVSHPKKNVLTRVMQPNQKKLTMAHCENLEDVAIGDYFFLCTDGILESVSDDLLRKIIGDDLDDKSKMKAICDACEKDSDDNFSAYLISISKNSRITKPVASAMQERSEKVPVSKTLIASQMDDMEENDENGEVITDSRQFRNAPGNRKTLIMVVIAVIACVLLGLYLLFTSPLEKEEKLTLYVSKSEKLGSKISGKAANKKDKKWESDNPSVATVTSQGEVKALKPGKADIVCRLGLRKVKTFKVTVESKQQTGAGARTPPKTTPGAGAGRTAVPTPQTPDVKPGVPANKPPSDQQPMTSNPQKPNQTQNSNPATSSVATNNSSINQQPMTSNPQKPNQAQNSNPATSSVTTNNSSLNQRPTPQTQQNSNPLTRPVTGATDDRPPVQSPSTTQPPKFESISRSDSSAREVVKFVLGQDTHRILGVSFNPSNAKSDIDWKSDDEGVATVANGRVTPVGEGKTTITATTKSFARDGKQKTVKWSVEVTSSR